MKKIIIINKIVFFLNIVFFFNLESKSTLKLVHLVFHTQSMRRPTIEFLFELSLLQMVSDGLMMNVYFTSYVVTASMPVLLNFLENFITFFSNWPTRTGLIFAIKISRIKANKPFSCC